MMSQDEARRAGEQAGMNATGIWADDAELIAAYMADAPRVTGADGSYAKQAARRHRSFNLILATPAFITVGVAIQATNGANRNAATAAVIFVFSAVLILAWVISVALYFVRTVPRAVDAEDAVNITYARTALSTIDSRREAFQAARTRGSIPAPPSPPAQPYGVSAAGAEAIARDWMRHLGEIDATVTRSSGDGGIDVISSHYLAQVKHHAGAIGVAAIRELAGVAGVDGRGALFFSSNGYAAGSVDFADRAGIALFQFNAEAGTLVGVNALGKELRRSGL